MLRKNKKNIAENLELLDKNIITRYIAPQYKAFSKQLIILDEISSTNTYLTELLKAQSNDKFLVCLAESQTAGRGRLGRQWFSPYACNIYLSLCWQFTCSVKELAGLSLVIAVAIVRALALYEVCNDITVKWPNDILWRGRKLGGILVEFFNKTSDLCYAVIGVGLNVDMPRDGYEKTWCDIAEIVGTKPARNKLVGLLINSLLASCKEFQDKGLQPFLRKWRLLDITSGKQVTIITPQQQKIMGIGCGVDEQGCFLLKNNFGKIQKFAVGDVSLRMDI